MSKRTTAQRPFRGLRTGRGAASRPVTPQSLPRATRLTICILALGCASEAPTGPEPVSERPATPLDLALAQLELSDGQRYEIDALLRAEEPWVAKLEHDRMAVEAALRTAETQRPFDPTRVATLIERRAEIQAYLRGTESRVVAEILELLEPQQRSIFSQLRARDPSARRVVTSRRPTLVSALP